jgi:hypothetical protein
VAILRMGGRVPMADDARDQVASGNPPVVQYDATRP